MNDLMWGMLGPENVHSERRTRTLGLGAAVRHFNELAVPGLGGVWFGKQLFLALLGIAVAERVRQGGGRSDNIQVTNAVEALGCWLAYRHNGRQRDDRLRGIDKLAAASGTPLFSAFGRRGFYVTQPMRMGTVQALRALGLVDAASERFNAYQVSQTGAALIEAGCGDLWPRRKHPIDALTAWVGGAFEADTATMRQLLSPVEPLPPLARALLLECLCRGSGDGATRRRDATEWVRALIAGQTNAGVKPPQLPEQHWHDVQAGALFFSLQKHAFAVLEVVEARLAASNKRSLPVDEVLGSVAGAAELLRQAAERFLAHRFADLEQTGANGFARECANSSNRELVESLLLRDERVLRLRDGVVLPGQAFDPSFQGSAPEEQEEVVAPDLALPEDVSYRLRNLYLLNLDVQGQLDAWLADGGLTENGDE